MFETLFGGAMDALGSATDTQNQINQDYTAGVNTAAATYTAGINERERYLADTANQRDMLDYSSDVNLANAENQAAVNLFDRRYEIENMQAGYDKFQDEFGDMQDNVYNTMKRLSSHSMEAQINERFNENLQIEMGGLQQRFAEMGINPSSGLYQASEMQLRMQTATNKIKETRNLDTEIAGIQQNFMNTESTSKYFTRPEDFEAGIMTDAEREAIIQPGDYQRAGEYDINTYDVQQADVVEAEREKFLGLF